MSVQARTSPVPDCGTRRGVGEMMRARGHHRGRDSSRQHEGREYKQQPHGSGHMATRRINKQDRADGCQREHAGGMAAREGLFDNLPDRRLKPVLSEADGGGHSDGCQDGAGPPAGRHAGNYQRQGDERDWS
jgi:hypothetical protein